MTTDKHGNTRSPYDFDGRLSASVDRTNQLYTGQCKGCSRTIEVSAQDEYYTKIFIRCSCGDLVGFVLPVN